jgi:hypothetical protein
MVMGTRDRSFVVALVALTIAWGAVLVDPGPNQNSQMARVTALAHGTPRIDRYRNWTRDTSYWHGHYYAAKAPGLAVATLPWYFVLRATGLLVHGPLPSVPWPAAEEVEMPRTAPWEFALWGALLPFVGVLMLVRMAAERLVPGYGTIAAVTLGAGSLVAVFATMFFDHELSAFLGFLAFALLLRERARAPSLEAVAAAGVAAGLAIGVEFPLGLLAIVLGVYALARPGRLKRGLAYCGGVAIGLVPLVVYDLWAYGTVKPIAYSFAVLDPGKSGHDVLGANASGFFGIGLPSGSALTDLLLGPKGLLVLTPVWALAAVGLVALWRGGRRAETAVVAAVVSVFLLYDAGYYLPFGGFNAGPRFLVPMLPFLALGLAAAWRAYPGPTLALACASVAVTTVSILADPMLVSEDVGTMFHRLERGGDQNGGLPWTILHWTWSAKVAPLLLIGVVVAVVVASVFAPVARRLTARDVALGVAALVAWRIAYVGGTLLVRERHGWAGGALLAVALSLAVALLIQKREKAAVPALLLMPLVWPAYAAHAGIATATISLALAATVASAVVLRPRAASQARS